MDVARLSQIEEAVEVLAQEGIEMRLVRELLSEVKRLRRSEGEGAPRLITGPSCTIHCRPIDLIRIVEAGHPSVTIYARKILEMWDREKPGAATFDYERGIPSPPPLPTTDGLPAIHG
jgi:hypothetical protein